MKKTLTLASLLSFPLVAFGQLANLQNNIIDPIGNIINKLIPIVFALAMLYFFWGLAQYILNSGDGEKKDEGKNKMIWGIVALFVMSAVWGIVRFIGSAVGVNPGQGADFNVGGLVPR